MKQASELLKKIADSQNVRAVVLTSGDGFAMEKEIRDDSLDADFLAVISRDVVSAARKMFLELDKGQLMQGIIEYSNGVVLFANLPRGTYLIVFATRQANKSRIWDSVAGNFRGLLEVV